MNLLQNARNLLTQVGMGLAVVATVVAGFALSAIFFAVFMAAGVIIGGWLWWQMRRLKKQQQAQFLDGNYVVIETEYELLEDQSRGRRAESWQDEQQPVDDEFTEFKRNRRRRRR